MQQPVPARKHTGRIMPLLAGGALLFSTLIYIPVKGAGASLLPQTGADTILVQKQVNSKKHKIRLYPNATQEVLFFSAQGEEGRVYQLFIFNLEGALVKQVNIKNKQTTVLNNIDKGNYLFEVFSDDERIESGQVIIR